MKCQACNGEGITKTCVGCNKSTSPCSDVGECPVRCYFCKGTGEEASDETLRRDLERETIMAEEGDNGEDSED